jgi:alkylation response protein AidB-like acyl-CoA dehydrogenase
MNFSHSPERQMMADALGRYLRERYTIEARHAAAYGQLGYSPERWSELLELGIAASLFDEAADGSGGTGFDIMVVFEQFGRALVVEPFLGLLMAGHALAAAGAHFDVGRFLSRESVLAFAHQETSGDATTAVETHASRTEGGWVLNGEKTVIAHAEASDAFFVSARSPAGISLFLVPADCSGVAVRGYLNIEGGRSGELTLRSVSLGPDALVGAEGSGAPLVEAAVDVGLLALSAEAVGIMDVIKDATCGHLRTRVQFGQPLGRFQALQHRMAVLLLEVEQARSSVINAAAAFNGADPIERRLALSAAKYTIGRAGTLVAEDAIQLHGAIGMTWELPLSHYAKRLVMIGHQLGDEDHHLERYADHRFAAQAIL